MDVHLDVNFEELARSTYDINKAVCIEAGMLALRRDATEINLPVAPNNMQPYTGGQEHVFVGIRPCWDIELNKTQKRELQHWKLLAKTFVIAKGGKMSSQNLFATMCHSQMVVSEGSSQKVLVTTRG
ncbi:hypothetical protein Tco_1215944 [Tanacetum coccineum]